MLKKKRATALSVLSVIVLLAFALASCATFERNAYVTEHISGTAYDTGMKVVSRLQAQGKITLAQRAEINKVGNVFYVSYHAAVDALEVYKQTNTQSARDILTASLAKMAANWATYAEYVNRVVPNSLPTKLEEVK